MVALKVLLCGGIAGVATWASVFPLDMIKTRLQAQTIHYGPEEQSLLGTQTNRKTLNTVEIAREVYRAEGAKAFYRGLGICSLRAFIVNAIQVCTAQLTSACRPRSLLTTYGTVGIL